MRVVAYQSSADISAILETDWSVFEQLLAPIVLKNRRVRARFKKQNMSTIRGSCGQSVAMQEGCAAQKPKKRGRRVARTKKVQSADTQVSNSTLPEGVTPRSAPELSNPQTGQIIAPSSAASDHATQVDRAAHVHQPIRTTALAPATLPKSEPQAEIPKQTDAGSEHGQTGVSQLKPTHIPSPHTAQCAEATQKNIGGKADLVADTVTRPKNRILIIEDDPIMRMLLKRGLSNFEFECILTENGRAAQAILQNERPDAFLVDLLMPVMDGLAFIKWLRQIAHDSTPVVVFTTVDNPKVKEEVLKSGADFFASKPLHIKELAETIKNLITSKRTGQ